MYVGSCSCVHCGHRLLLFAFPSFMRTNIRGTAGFLYVERARFIQRLKGIAIRRLPQEFGVLVGRLSASCKPLDLQSSFAFL